MTDTKLSFGCTCDLRHRSWNPCTGVCETCGNRFRDLQTGQRSVTAYTKPEPPDEVWLLEGRKRSTWWDRDSFDYDSRFVTQHGPYVPKSKLVAAHDLIAQMSEGMDCLPGCDSIAHEELCPVVNPARALQSVTRGETDALMELNEVNLALQAAQTERDAAAGYQRACADYFELRPKHDALEIEVARLREALGYPKGGVMEIMFNRERRDVSSGTMTGTNLMAVLDVPSDYDLWRIVP
ncbi:hypothetical protein LCGC14_2787080, partial [marine sediment metagenome]